MNNPNFLLNYNFQNWQDLFIELYVKSVPLEYVKCIRLTFSNERIWEFDIDHLDSDSVQGLIKETLNEYNNEISKVDIQIDIDRFQTNFKSLF